MIHNEKKSYASILSFFLINMSVFIKEDISH
jgi:hypothetical protein